jgi:DNA-binding LytR/AlgR family response regulator
MIFHYLRKRLITKNPEPVKLETTVFISDNATILKLDINDIIFMKAEGNYVEIYEKHKKHLIRSTLKKIINDNKESGLLRSHRSYLINTGKIVSITGNTKGYKINLKDYDGEIPASPKAGRIIKDIISKRT